MPVPPRETDERSIRSHFAVALIALAITACRSSDESSASPSPSSTATLVGMEQTTYEIGRIARARDYSMSVETVQECATSRPFLPAKSNKVVGVEVVIEGQTEREVPVNPFYATVIDAGGDEYSSTLAGCSPALRAERVVQGRKARGFISFEVPKNVKTMTMRYAPTVIGVGREELRFDLAQ